MHVDNYVGDEGEWEVLDGRGPSVVVRTARGCLMIPFLAVDRVDSGPWQRVEGET